MQWGVPHTFLCAWGEQKDIAAMMVQARKVWPTQAFRTKIAWLISVLLTPLLLLPAWQLLRPSICCDVTHCSGLSRCHGSRLQAVGMKTVWVEDVCFVSFVLHCLSFDRNDTNIDHYGVYGFAMVDLVTRCV